MAETRPMRGVMAWQLIDFKFWYTRMMRLIKLLGLLLTIYAGMTAGCDDTVEAAVFNPDTFTLRNGMQVVVISNHRAPIVTHMVWYKVGSADEPPGKTGVAHFLEHLMFKATRNLKSGEFSKIPLGCCTN